MDTTALEARLAWHLADRRIERARGRSVHSADLDVRLDDTELEALLEAIALLQVTLADAAPRTLIPQNVEA